MQCDLAHFALLIQQHARRVSITREVYANLNRAAEAFIQKAPETAEARLLARFADALRDRAGTFREAEVYVLGNEALAIAVSLLDATMLGFEPGDHPREPR